LKERKWDRFTF